MTQLDERLVSAFTEAAYFLRAKVRDEGWKWTSNFCREYARCVSHIPFSNSLSPLYLREVARRHPDLACYIVTGSLKQPAETGLFDE